MDYRKTTFRRRQTMLFNIHTHTCHSHDATAPLPALCEKALREGLLGFAVTDHCDCECSSEPRAFTSLMDSFEDCEKAKARYGDRLVVAAGVEIGEALYDRAFAKKVIASRPWDVVLGSVHAVRMENWERPFSILDFSGCSDAFLRDYLRQYFDDLTEMAATEDYDVLCHLTVPLRYICVKYGRPVDISLYEQQIDEILKIAIERDKTLEINTSGCTPDQPRFMPDETILDRYLAMGGRNLTIGSDAHVTERLTNGLDQAVEMLNRKGVVTLTYYLNRKHVQYHI